MKRAPFRCPAVIYMMYGHRYRPSLASHFVPDPALVSAFFLSTWLYKVAKETYLLTDKLLIFGAPAVVALVCIVAIAYAGNYQRHQRFGNKYTAFALIVISSAVAVAATFLPQQPTSDQFFTEEQFESYRKLGYHSLM